MTQKQGLKELLRKLKNWKEGGRDENEFNDILNEFESALEGENEEDDGSNPPHGPGTPP